MAFDILIADSGSTKTAWTVLTALGEQKIITQGISPYFLSSPEITSLLQQELLPAIPDATRIREVYYYGTGCTAPGTVGIVFQSLQQLFPEAAIQVDYDLVAAAHALCGKSEGIACILGTGSNSCYFDGDKIRSNSPGLGYILGDEGSGAHLGKKLISEYLYGRLGDDVEEIFSRRFSTDKDLLLEEVYTAELPNRFLASFSVFFSEHRGIPALEKLLMEGLDDFFRVHLSTYTQCQSVPIHFTGGIAWTYRDVLEDLCAQHDYVPGKIIKEPMSGLVDYYRTR